MKKMKLNRHKYELTAAERSCYLDLRGHFAQKWGTARKTLLALEYEGLAVCEVVPTTRFVWIRLSCGIALWVYRRRPAVLRNSSVGDFDIPTLEALHWALPRGTSYLHLDY